MKNEQPEIPPDEPILDRCLGIPGNTKADGDMEKNVLSNKKCAVVQAELTVSEEYGAAWNDMVEWMKKNKYEIDMPQPGYDICLNKPEKHPEKRHIAGHMHER